MMSSARKIQKSIMAILVAADTIPPKPKIAAIIAIIRNRIISPIIAHLLKAAFTPHPILNHPLL
jgi:hypothetical protein